MKTILIVMKKMYQQNIVKIKIGKFQQNLKLLQLRKKEAITSEAISLQWSGKVSYEEETSEKS